MQSDLSFDAWFASVWKHNPFPWQSRLAAEAEFPECIAAPTGSGKTALIDVWLWRHISSRALSIRLWYIVDRRCLVDGAYERACQLVERTGADVQVVRLRGGVFEQDTRPLSPSRPAIICSTVDQFGSRLLGCGYGCGPANRIYQMAIAGTDSIVVVDEAHISEPLVQTLTSATEFGAAVQLVQMTATPPDGVTRLFRLDDTDKSHPVLSSRISARKLAKLSSGDLSSHAKSLRRRGARAVSVWCNSVQNAIDTASDLRQTEADVVLITGRQREHERSELMATWGPRLQSASAESPEVYVVTTQALEVGVDWDFDGLVTECASIDALKQRFGRLDRIGRQQETNAVIVKGDKSSIYGDSLTATWRWLGEIANKKVVDFGISAQETWEIPSECSLPATLAPLLTKVQLNDWSITSDRVGADVAPWLHGDQQEVNCRLCWRRDITGVPLDIERVEAAPPVMAETAGVPVSLVRKRLEKRPVVIWRGAATLVPADAAKPGDVIVVPAAYDERSLACLQPDDPLDILEDVSPIVRVMLDEEDASPEEIVESLDPSQRQRLGQNPDARPYPGGWVLSASPAERSVQSSRPVFLDEHTDAVEKLAVEVASVVCPDLVGAVRIAARWHDMGKRDPRFQDWLGANGRPLAKSGQTWARARARRASSGYPLGRRHEFLSAAMAHEAGVSDALTLHLIEAHHGRACVPPDEPNDEVPVLVDNIGADSTVIDLDRFWQLVDQLGYWNLAQATAVLMYADWETSRREQLG